MQYLLSVIDNRTGSGTSEEDADIDVFNDRLVADGHWVFAGGLDSPATATVIDNRDGAGMITDGPFVETKEMVGSAFLIEAADMEDAVRVASLHPATQVIAGAPFGWGLEIRPIHYFKSLDTPDVTWRPPK